MTLPETERQDLFNSNNLLCKGNFLRNKHTDETYPIEKVIGYDVIIRLKNKQLIKISETLIEEHWKIIKQTNETT